MCHQQSVSKSTQTAAEVNTWSGEKPYFSAANEIIQSKANCKICSVMIQAITLEMLMSFLSVVAQWIDERFHLI